MLRQWAGEWSALQGPLDGFVSDMDGGVAHIEGNNTGPGTEAFVDFMHSEESGLESIRNLALAAPRVAAGYEAAALVVEALRIAVIAKLMIDAIRLAAAIITGGIGAAVSFIVGKGLGAAIDWLIDQAINTLLGT